MTKHDVSAYIKTRLAEIDAGMENVKTANQFFGYI